jgi:hypothetical protein
MGEVEQLEIRCAGIRVLAHTKGRRYVRVLLIGRREVSRSLLLVLSFWVVCDNRGRLNHVVEAVKLDIEEPLSVGLLMTTYFGERDWL